LSFCEFQLFAFQAINFARKISTAQNKRWSLIEYNDKIYACACCAFALRFD
jgi:hypothetical protein